MELLRTGNYWAYLAVSLVIWLACIALLRALDVGSFWPALTIAVLLGVGGSAVARRRLLRP